MQKRIDQSNLKFPNSYGGYNPSKDEYVISLTGDKWTPAPWVNILASPNFGTLISESGSSFTWSKNSYLFRVTPWTGDWISDPSGERIYFQDLDDKHVWTPTPLPIRKETPYLVRHGKGYTTFEGVFNQVESTLNVFVARHDPIKFFRLKLANKSHRKKRIAAYFYFEWVLGSFRNRARGFLVTTIDGRTNSVLARNLSSEVVFDEVSFAGNISRKSSCHLLERSEFFGEEQSFGIPEWFNHSKGRGRARKLLDPCGVVRILCNLDPGEEKETVFFLGCSREEQISKIISRYRPLAEVEKEFQAVVEFWKNLNPIKIQTPDDSLNVLFNNWLLYQTLSSRLWGRTGFYQPGGAHGFRDQLQDSLAFVWSRSNIARAQILEAASHQYPDGNVEHWWHPGVMGALSKNSDDCLWIVYAAIVYTQITQDFDVLREKVSFKQIDQSQPKKPQAGTLYDHCTLSIDRVLTKRGKHNLPLILSGDWNDSLNRVGAGGEGESVWLAMFLIDNLLKFAPVCETMGETERAKAYRQAAKDLSDSLNKFAWDGDRFLRGFFDDGYPLGSGSNSQGKIDSLPQSWSVIMGLAEKGRTRQAMESLKKYLLDKENQLLCLLSPPFDNPDRDPGYIKDYPPGVRENGSQYNHAALWVILAFTLLGDGEMALQVLNMLNPFKRSGSAAKAENYAVEPYVLASDIYSGSFAGRGGWTWYTGSAGLMYRIVVENIIGLRFQGATLGIKPCVPNGWRFFSATFRYHSANYKVVYDNRKQAGSVVDHILVDGVSRQDKVVRLIDDGQDHLIEVILG